MAEAKNEAGWTEDELALIYDGECPVCTAYSGAVDVDRKDASGVRRINARSDDDLVKRAREAGLDLDEGMVVVHKGQLYHGADALHLMATLAPNSGIKNRLNKLLFGSRTVSRLSYPALRGGRNLLLKMLGRTKIRDIDRANQPQR
jgi:predicted DCC family thiol-disulfide oxidoreductase YuxK